MTSKYVGVLFVAITALSISLAFSGNSFLNEGQAEAETEHPPIMFIVVESTRADHVGPCYGYERETAPMLCDLAEDGVVFENAYSQGSGTPTAMPVMLTGLPPNAVGIPSFEQEVSENIPKVSDSLHDEGYETIIYRDTDVDFNFHEGLKRKPIDYNSTSNQVYQHVFIQESAHFPYTPEKKYRLWDNISLTSEEIFELRNKDSSDYFRHWHEPFLENYTKEDMIDLYDADIRKADSYIGEIVQNWKDQGKYEDALIIVTSDHGEYFGEHIRGRMDASNREDLKPWDWGHGGPPFDEVTKVPLVVKFPDNQFAGSRIEEPVRHVDIVPTIYDVLNIDPQITLHGQSLRAAIKEGKSRFIYSSALPDEWWMSKNRTHTWMVRNPESYCDNGDSGQRLCLNSAGSDPECTSSDVQVSSEVAHNLCQIWDEGEKNYYSDSERRMNEETVETLEDLGYLN